MSTAATGRKAQSHDRIVEVAARALRREGYHGVGVADVMREAGLTHGGFYAHFESRDALLVEALERAGRGSAQAIETTVQARQAQGDSPFRALIEGYLADAHLAAPDRGCPVAALGSEMPRQSAPLRAASRRRVQALIERVRGALPQAAAAQAPVVAAQLVGALQLARALDDRSQGRTLLAATRQSLLARFDAGAVSASGPDADRSTDGRPAPARSRVSRASRAKPGTGAARQA